MYLLNWPRTAATGDASKLDASLSLVRWALSAAAWAAGQFNRA
jgi:hypothetical protein